MHARAEVYHPSQSSKSVLTGFLCIIGQKNRWPNQAFFKHFLHTPCISNSAILHNNYISLLSDLCACVHGMKKWRRKGSHSSSVSGSTALWDFKPDGLVHCSVENVAVLCENHCDRFTQFWTSLYDERSRKPILAIWQRSGSVLFRCFLAVLGVLLAIKALGRWMHGMLL